MVLKPDKVYRRRGESLGVGIGGGANAEDDARWNAMTQAYASIGDSIRAYLATRIAPEDCSDIGWRLRDTAVSAPEEVQSQAMPANAPFVAAHRCIVRVRWEIEYWCEPEVVVGLGELLHH